MAHNRKLARRNRRQTPPTVPPETFGQDYLGRPLISPVLALLKQAPLIEVAVNDDQEKVYTIVGSGEH